MNTVLQSPAWADASVEPGTAAASLRQLVNAAGPLANGMAVALTLVQRAELAEADGKPAPLDATERAQLIAMCAVTAQMLAEVAQDSADDLVSLQS